MMKEKQLITILELVLERLNLVLSCLSFLVISFGPLVFDATLEVRCCRRRQSFVFDFKYRENDCFCLDYRTCCLIDEEHTNLKTWGLSLAVVVLSPSLFLTTSLKCFSYSNPISIFTLALLNFGVFFLKESNIVIIILKITTLLHEW